MKKFIMMLFIALLILPLYAFAEKPVMISHSETMTNVVFDGKWTFLEEWKNSSHNLIQYDSGEMIHLRSAHQEDFVFFMINFISDTTLDTNMDRATICLEPYNEKNIKSDSNDYCFVAVFGSKSSHILQGGSTSAISGNFKKIFSESGYVGIGNISDENDRYSKIPHVSYEFKIPTALINRTSEYGLYISVFDYSSEKLFTWPKEIQQSNSFQIPNPSLWGTMISPDKSLPEFDLPLVILISLISSIILLQKAPKTSLFKTL